MVLIKILIGLVILELLAMFTVKGLRRRFQWLITPDDELPKLDKEGLSKFFKHGYDPELGWARKPNTSHDEKGKSGTVTFYIDEKGARKHPGFEGLKPVIACYGDSFTFSRQVEDNQTWPYYLSDIAKKGVLNFGVGNYGVDQACLRMEKKIKQHKADITVMGVVPSTIVRILCVWKHYSEFGNTFGFKPRFDIKDGEFTYIKNIIDSESKFDNYKEYIDDIRKNDYFYTTKFKDEMIRFPFLISILRKPSRNIRIISSLMLPLLLEKFGKKFDPWESYAMKVIMQVNFKLRYNLFHNEYAVRLLQEIIKRYASIVRENGSKPVFVLLSQKDDVLFAKRTGSYYADFIKDISKEVFTVDMTKYLLEADNLNELYSENSDYGGHHSPKGNKFIADTIYNELKCRGLLDAEKEYAHK